MFQKLVTGWVWPACYGALTPGLVGRQTYSSVKFSKCCERSLHKVQWDPRQEGVMCILWGWLFDRLHRPTQL